MRDWTKALRPASFRGVSFRVEEDGPEGGRRVAVHEISGGEAVVTEDMGRLVRRFTVTAYIVGDLSDFEGLALEQACDAAGMGLLRLPMDPFQMVLCEGCRRSRRKDRGGYVAYDLAFVEAGSVEASPGSTRSQMRDTMATTLADVSAALAPLFQILSAITSVMAWISDIVDLFLIDADDLVQARRLILEARQGGVSGVQAFLEVCRLIGEAAPDPSGLVDGLDGLDDLSTLGMIGALVIRCFAALRIDYPARPDAQAGRSALVAAADPVYETAGTEVGADVLAFLVRLVGQAAVAISAIAATRAGLVRVETGLSLPSSLIAYDLYGDPERGREIVVRNRTGTPMIMPVVIEASAR